MIAPSDAIDLPPYAALLGISADGTHTPDGLPILRMDYDGSQAGGPGALHGGAIAGLLDMTAHAALTETLRQSGQPPRFKPIGITIDYVRVGRHQATYARGKVTKVGKRVATVVVEAWQDEVGTPIAAARIHMLMQGSE
jgi:uncharacterized protein (TIGR00369 family)